MITKNFARLTSLILLNILIYSSASGYFLFKLPAAESTLLTALIP